MHISSNYLILRVHTLIFQLIVLPFQILNVLHMGVIFPSHELNILSCLFQDLSPACLEIFRLQYVLILFLIAIIKLH